jgi:hypothetical protein
VNRFIKHLHVASKLGSVSLKVKPQRCYRLATNALDLDKSWDYLRNRMGHIADMEETKYSDKIYIGKP